MVHITDTRA